MPKIEKIKFSTAPEKTIQYLKDKKLELSFDYK